MRSGVRKSEKEEGTACNIEIINQKKIR